MKRVTFLLLFSITWQVLSAQSPYNFNWKRDLGITVIAGTTNFLGLHHIDGKPNFTDAEISALNINDINAFDRGAAKTNAGFYETARHRSDLGMNISFGLPLLLALDKTIADDYWNVMAMYLETEAIVGNFYAWGAANFVDRARPSVYNPDVPISEKYWGGNRNSFYSGHVASPAAATFFMAKVYSDYHPEIGNKKYLAYGLASLPPAFVGIYRYHAGKHFPTDILTGFVMGAATGILVPELHKKKDKNKGSSWLPMLGNYTGMQYSYTF